MKRPNTGFANYRWVQLTELIERIKKNAAESRVVAGDHRNIRMMQAVQVEMAYLIYALREGIGAEAERFLDAPVKSYKLSPPIPNPPVVGLVSNAGVHANKLFLVFSDGKDELVHRPEELGLITHAYWFSTTQHTTD